MKVVASIVAGSIALLKVAWTVPATGTPLAPARGTTEATVGAEFLPPVLKFQSRFIAMESPEALLHPVVIVAVYEPSPSSGTVGWNTAVSSA